MFARYKRTREKEGKKTNIMDRISYQDRERERERKSLNSHFFYYCTSIDDRRAYVQYKFLYDSSSYIYAYLYECLL